MSCSDRALGRRLTRTGVALAALAVLGTTAACASGSSAEAAPATPSGTPADATTGRLAEVEFARQCAVDTANHADETGFTTDLDDRLAAVGLTHAEWKRWHDALADSPELVAQFADAGAAGCPAG